MIGDSVLPGKRAREEIEISMDKEERVPVSTNEMLFVTTRRVGGVLAHDRILKGDMFPSGRDSSLPIQLPNAPNFRQAENGQPVYGCGQPSIEGIVEVLHEVAAMNPNGNGTAVTWFNLRMEPVIYINGKPYCVKDRDSPFSNLEDPNITPDAVAAREQALKQEILAEAVAYGGRILLHDERPVLGQAGAELAAWGEVYAHWERVDDKESGVRTVEEVFADASARMLQTPPHSPLTFSSSSPSSSSLSSSSSSSNPPTGTVASLAFHRVPIADEKKPQPVDFDRLLRGVCAPSSASSSPPLPSPFAPPQRQSPHPFFTSEPGCSLLSANSSLSPSPLLLPDSRLKLCGEDCQPTACYVFNCQLGRGRATTGMVVAAMLLSQPSSSSFHDPAPACAGFGGDRSSRKDRSLSADSPTTVVEPQRARLLLVENPQPTSCKKKPKSSSCSSSPCSWPSSSSCVDAALAPLVSSCTSSSSAALDDALHTPPPCQGQTAGAAAAAAVFGVGVGGGGGGGPFSPPLLLRGREASEWVEKCCRECGAVQHLKAAVEQRVGKARAHGAAVLNHVLLGLGRHTHHDDFHMPHAQQRGWATDLIAVVKALSAKQRAEEEVGLQYLLRYASLVLFAEFLLERGHEYSGGGGFQDRADRGEAGGEFSNWLQHHPDGVALALFLTQLKLPSL